MGNKGVDSRFTRESWEAPGPVGKYVSAVTSQGLWESERLMAAKHLRKSAHVLDIGCGAGRTTHGLYQIEYRNIEGVDLSSAMIESARSIANAQGYQIPFQVASATDLPYEDESFNGAVSFGCALQCIPGAHNRLLALKEARRILEPGGYLIFTTHDRLRNEEFAEFWKEEAIRWEQGRQDKRLIELGDRIYDEVGHPTFVHIPLRSDVVEMVQQAGLVLAEDRMRSEICVEKDEVLHNTIESRVWVVRRP